MDSGLTESEERLGLLLDEADLEEVGELLLTSVGQSESPSLPVCDGRRTLPLFNDLRAE